MYACFPTKADISRLNALDQWCLRRIFGVTIFGVTRRDRVTNKEVRNQTDQPPLSEMIQPRCLVFLGHVLRMAPSMDTCRALFCTIPTSWKRPAGRPRQTWLATITKDLDQLGISMDDVHELAADHALWQGLIHVAGACF